MVTKWPIPVEAGVGPGAGAGPRAAGDQQAVVGKRLESAGKLHLPALDVDAGGARPHPPETEALVQVALVGLDVAVRQLSAEDVHQRRAGEGVVGLFRHDGDLPVRLALAHRQRRLHAGDSVSYDDGSHCEKRFTCWMTEARVGFKVPPHLAATACCSPFAAGIVTAGARG